MTNLAFIVFFFSIFRGPRSKTWTRIVSFNCFFFPLYKTEVASPQPLGHLVQATPENQVSPQSDWERPGYPQKVSYFTVVLKEKVSKPPSSCCAKPLHVGWQVSAVHGEHLGAAGAAGPFSGSFGFCKRWSTPARETFRDTVNWRKAQ